MVNHLWLKGRLWFDSLVTKNSLYQDYLNALTSQFNLPIAQTKLMAVDLEMTGLDPKLDQIISIGLIPIYQGSLPLNQARHVMIGIEGSVGHSATVHGIVDNQLADALTIEQAMAWFLKQTQGHILVAHHAPLDIAFLQNNLASVFGQAVMLPFIDTLAIERKRYLHQHGQLIEGCLRLGQSRERYHLPIYAAHNALIDAIACAELLLAQLSAMGGINTIKCHELVNVAK
ncbi:exonuclease domain-containing protein [Shewanella aestuarii]|uniref:3'-5' exonuclease n=1 Tax=Shewanella aestuarii TaxID=1028752 RepID=A0A6G9QLC3_9GAMM|nr:exonuclease domain-containing protein [Shewanella aestuarii]QIR14865.1 3'-5' exonuclease [Shewanella aestuarii]